MVNTRRDCRELHELLPGETIHLSASMCGEHRTKVITEIKQKLQSGLPVRVVSTQLVEAGVDIDVPVVYRAFSGLASIAQAAGRCNREGRATVEPWWFSCRLSQPLSAACASRMPCGLLAAGWM